MNKVVTGPSVRIICVDHSMTFRNLQVNSAEAKKFLQALLTVRCVTRLAASLPFMPDP